MRLSPLAYRRITLGALIALCGIVVTGAAVRLTGSGLGCSDWPTCEAGQFHAELEFRPMMEWLNRLLTGAVSISVMLAVGGSLFRVPRRRDLTRWSWSLVLGVVAQIFIGAAVTKTDLNYSVVGVHFIASMVLVWAATVLHHRVGIPDDVFEAEHGRLRWPAVDRWLLALAAGILLTGPVVTSAGPHAGDEHVKRLPLDVGWTARVHSTFVWAFLVMVVICALRARRDGDAVMVRRVTDLLVAAVAQGAIGYAQYFSGVPPVLVGLHVAGATLVWVLAIRVGLASARPTAPTAPRPDVETVATRAVTSTREIRASLAPTVEGDVALTEDVDLDRPWIVLVWNDPINLMEYVTFVLQKLFGYSIEKATSLMLDVHQKGKAVVSNGTREKAELDVFRLHEHGLWATMQQDD